MKFLIQRVENGELSGDHPDGINVCFADGAVYFLDNSISVDELRALFTISGGESITRQDLLVRGILR